MTPEQGVNSIGQINVDRGSNANSRYFIEELGYKWLLLIKTVGGLFLSRGEAGIGNGCTKTAQPQFTKYLKLIENQLMKCH